MPGTNGEYTAMARREPFRREHVTGLIVCKNTDDSISGSLTRGEARRFLVTSIQALASGGGLLRTDDRRTA